MYITYADWETVALLNKSKKKKLKEIDKEAFIKTLFKYFVKIICPQLFECLNNHLIKLAFKHQIPYYFLTTGTNK